MSGGIGSPTLSPTREAIQVTSLPSIQLILVIVLGVSTAVGLAGRSLHSLLLTTLALLLSCFCIWLRRNCQKNLVNSFSSSITPSVAPHSPPSPSHDLEVNEEQRMTSDVQKQSIITLKRYLICYFPFFIFPLSLFEGKTTALHMSPPRSYSPHHHHLNLSL